MNLFDVIRQKAKLKRQNKKTTKAYINWVKQYIIFHNKKHPRDMRESEIEQFLSHLAIDKKVSASTQNQAFYALLFLYRDVLNIKLDNKINAIRAKSSNHIPVVLSREEIDKLFNNLSELQLLIIKLMYGTGMRVSEVAKLRIKDVDFDRQQITIRNSKHSKDRVVNMPNSLIISLQQQIEKRELQHKHDLTNGFGSVYLPDRLKHKYNDKDFVWQYVFASSKITNGLRWHISITTIQSAIKAAIKKAGINKKASCHTLRHSFATHMIEDGYDITTIQKILGHKNIRSTMIYTQLAKVKYKSPIDKTQK